ncbi:hypothetical protein LTR37_018025 [Vermiconidia calcicola]|uniref:Uncharacterized protein n=1 Tax=Vermiconidia calcicola TaxID=1690605 RepID=A0ACC3MIE2_9PEZI|nr:hypothetical protein LTR37_018025 [Vermiconidia calcicola]
MASSAHWILALVELLYYVPSAPPLIYVLWKHRHTGISGWLFLLVFVILQCTGCAMIVSAGKGGTPSSTAIIIVQVGLSPLILDTRVLRTYWDGKGPQGTEDHHDRKHVFHVAVGTAIAIYAVGASGSFKQPPPATARTLYKTGIVLVLVMFLALCTAFGLVAWQSKGVHEAKALFYTITISLMLQTIRTVFAVTSAFSQDDPSFNPVTGRVVYQVVFVFLPGALVVSAMITGGALTTSICTYDSYRPVAVPLISRETSSRTVSF